MEKGSFEMMKQLNERIILQEIRCHGPISRAEIAKRTQLTPPTVSKVVLELLEARLVLETEMGESSGGRRPILLTINPKGGYVLGLAISLEGMQVMLTDLEMTPLSQMQIPLESLEPQRVVDFAASVIRQLQKDTAIPTERILGVGVALQGWVDHSKGIVLWAPHLQWQNLPIRPMLEAAIGLPVVVDTDLRLMAVGEMWKGVAQGTGDFAYVHLDSSVGTGLILHGEPLRGGNGFAGEIGHMVAQVDGPLCYCGKRGCLETLISLSALQGLDGDTIRQIVGTWLGRGLATMIHLLDIRKVVLGGRVLALADGLIPAVREEFDRQVFPWIRTNVEIIPGRLGTEARMIGAITMILSEFYNGGIRR